ncbi:MAG: nucleoside monophosphate kinase [Isosphaeraceae bacterium]
MADRKKYRTILLFGMPGSGKGTQGAVLGQLPGFVHVSMGDVFRKIPKWGRFGQEIARYTSQGQLVPDDLTVRIWENHIKILELQELLLPEQQTLVLDGLPRNYAQAERLEEFLDVIQIFHLKINDTVKAMERLKGRALRENRLDDMNEEVIRRRLNSYFEETFKTLSLYPPEIVYDVDAGQSPLDVLGDIVNQLSMVSKSRSAPRSPIPVPAEALG